MRKITYNTQKGPKPAGPYSSAVIHGDLIYVSGIGPIDPETNIYAAKSVEKEAHCAFKNVGTILEELHSSFADVLKVTLYLADINYFDIVNKIYMQYFGPEYPARTTIQAGKLPMGIKLEIEVTASQK